MISLQVLVGIDDWAESPCQIHEFAEHCVVYMCAREVIDMAKARVGPVEDDVYGEKTCTE